MASTKLTKTYSSAGNRRTYTLSLWAKFASTGANLTLVNIGPFSGDNEFRLRRDSNDRMEIYDYGSSAYKMRIRTNRLFRDVNGWYHIVLAVDTTQGTVSDRVKLYINGVQETSFSAETQANSNLETAWGIAQNYTLAAHESGDYMDGQIAHFHYVDGTAHTPTTFGETDATTGIWKPKTAPSVTHGTNGFFLKFENSAAMGTDSSGGGNNWTVNGSITQLIDTPSNVFCTANPLSLGTSTVLSNGNTTARNDTGTNSTTLGTIGFGNGKYYWEGYRHGGGNIGIGVCNADVSGSDNNSVTAGRVLYYENGTIFCEGLSDQSNITTGVTYADTDIISVSMDTENGILKFYKNDTLVTNSTITNSKFTNAENIWLPHTYQNNGGEWRLNFGNGYFGTTVISSQGTNASNNGKFEYDVKPSDATALSTKGLNL